VTKPTLEMAAHPDAVLAVPIALTVVDEQTGDRGADYRIQILNAICDAYPRAVEAMATNAGPIPARVNMTVRIHRIGGFFSNARAPLLAQNRERIEPTGTVDDWRPVILATSGTGRLTEGRVFVFLPGNWSGIVDLDIELRDLRPGHTADFTLPLAAERQRPNMHGYIEARIAAGEAWDAVQPRLNAFIEAAVGKLAVE
jgi:hypothetical protein